MDVTRRSWVRAARSCLAVLTLLPAIADASGHSPLFGAATPTLGKGGWQFDQAWMGQAVKAPEQGGQVLRSMIGFGVTEKLQVSMSLPLPLSGSHMLPSGRMMSMMSSNRDVEALAGWRFQTRPAGHGARLESTMYVGATVPLTSHTAGIRTAPAGSLALTSGYASRSHYFWAGASYQHTLEHAGDRLGAVTSWSLVYGYRPPAWRLEYPKPDLRLFIEAVGDSTAVTRHAGTRMPNTGGRVMLVGPTALLLYKAYGLGAGILFPFHQQLNGTQPRERFRFALNFTYFFWPGTSKGSGS